ncbi:MAG: hypothetical protein NVS3B12_24870 [Acidimicrobiales bacterium]
MNNQNLTVEVDIGSSSSRGRPPDRTWMVRLRRGDRSLIVTIGLDRSAADSLAKRITEIIHDDRAEEEVTPLA